MIIRLPYAERGNWDRRCWRLFLVGDTIEITTRRYNEAAGYTFSADLNHEFIEIGKNMNCEVGTTILIKINQKTYDAFRYQPNEFNEVVYFYLHSG